MREIKFRAKTIEGIWVYGYYFYSELEDKHYIAGESKYYDFQMMEVKKETVGQYTGIKDKNGKEIYEGDIATQHKLRAEHLGEKNFEIIYYQDECGFEIATLSEDRKERYLTPLHKTIEIEVIGNIYENANLLK